MPFSNQPHHHHYHQHHLITINGRTPNTVIWPNACFCCLMFALFKKKKEEATNRYQNQNNNNNIPIRNQLVISFLFKWSATESFICLFAQQYNNNTFREEEEKNAIKMIAGGSVALVCGGGAGINAFVFFCGICDHWCHLNRPTRQLGNNRECYVRA